MYEMLISESDRCILHDKPLLEPLFSLLAHYQTSPESLELDRIVSQLNQSLCLWIGRDPTLLPVFFCCGQEDKGKTGFSRCCLPRRTRRGSSTRFDASHFQEQFKTLFIFISQQFWRQSTSVSPLFEDNNV